MKQWVVLCMLASVTFSGCLGFLEDDATTDADPDAMDGVGGNETANVTNTPPAVDFTANQTQGEVPFDVRFDFNASDADGDNLTWALDADGDGAVDSNGTGAALPFNFTFTYDAAGTYNATLNVTDGTNATVGVVSINATEPEEGGEGEQGGAAFEPWSASGTAQMVCVGCIPLANGAPAPLACVGLAAGESGVDCVFAQLPDGAEGQTAVIIGDGVDGTWAEYSFLASCSPDASVQESNSGYDGLKTTVPEGAGCIVMYDSFLPGTTLTINVG